MWFSNYWKIWIIEGLPTNNLSFFRGFRGFSVVSVVPWFFRDFQLCGSMVYQIQCAYNIRIILSMFQALPAYPEQFISHILCHSELGFSEICIQQECDANILWSSMSTLDQIFSGHRIFKSEYPNPNIRIRISESKLFIYIYLFAEEQLKIKFIQS